MEYTFGELPVGARLRLLERLVHQTRADVVRRRESWDAGLSAMSLDPEIQRELSLVAAEFRATESDKLADD